MLPELREADTACPGEPQEKISLLIPCGITYSHSQSPTGVPQHYGEETTEMLTARAKVAIDYIPGQTYGNVKIIIATHCAYYGYLVRYLLGIESPESFCRQVNNCGITHIKIRKNDIPIVVCANDRGYTAEYKEGAKRLFSVITRDGALHELFNSKTGEGMGSMEQGRTAAVYIKIFNKLN